MHDNELTAKTKLNANGRIVLPAAMRKAAGVKPGDEVLLRFEEGEIRIYTLANAVRRLQELTRRYTRVRGGGVDAFLHRRRSEGQREKQAGSGRRGRAARA